MPEQLRRPRALGNGSRAMRVTVRGVRVNLQMLRRGSLLFVGLRRDRRKVSPSEIRRRKRVDHERHHSGHHGHETSEGKLPRRFGEARRGEILEGVWEDVDEPRRQDHSGGESLHQEEEASLRSQRRERLSRHRETHAYRPGGEDCGHGD